jgi:glycosyltransferase involved in cell wall biosynthesis
MKRYSISIFFPCFNEELNVKKVAFQALDVARQISDDFEIIIVNDGSHDRTGEIANQLVLESPEIRVVNHEINQGYGAALQSGFKASTKELVFYTDGDGQFDIKEIIKLLPLIEKYDIVSGCRAKRMDPMIRKLNAFMWGILINVLFNLKVKDIDSAFKLYRGKIFDNITLESRGALIDTEILAKAKAKGYTITEVEVSHFPRLGGKQTGAQLKVILKAFEEAFILRKRMSAEI